MKKVSIFLSAMSLFCISFNSLNAQTGTFTDTRDQQVYKTVKIGQQTWMAQNLNYTSANGSWCYDNSQISCDKFGKLYDWETAKNVCPAGWHLPLDKEWTVLTDFLGGEDLAGGKMKDTTNLVWLSPNVGANNSAGFNGIPGGFRNAEGQYGDTEMENGMYGNWWTSTDLDADYALRRRLAYKFEAVGNTEGLKKNGYSVRCVKD